MSYAQVCLSVGSMRCGMCFKHGVVEDVWAVYLSLFFLTSISSNDAVTDAALSLPASSAVHVFLPP